MNFCIGAINLILAFFMLYICMSYWNKTKSIVLQKSNNCYILDFLFSICFLKLGLYYFMPSVTHLLTDWSGVLNANVDPIEVMYIYILEFISYSIYFYTLKTCISHYRPNLSIDLYANSNSFVSCVLVGGISFYLGTSFIKEGSIMDSLWLFVPFFKGCSLALSIFVLVNGKQVFNILNVCLAICLLCIYSFYAISVGVRSLIFWPSLLFIYFSFVFNKKRLKVFLPMGIGGLVFLGVFQNVLVSQRGNINKNASTIERVSIMTDSHTKSRSISLFDEVDSRFGAMTTYGVGYLRLAHDEKYAGLEPVINSLYAPIPRAIFKDKPVPCSVDGTEYGQGMYMGMAAVTHNPYCMTEPTTAGHAYWELGILGVLLYSIIPAIYVYWCMVFFSKFGLISLPIFYGIFKGEFLEPKLWVSAIVLQLFQYNLPSCIFYILYKKINKNFITHEW